MRMIASRLAAVLCAVILLAAPVLAPTARAQDFAGPDPARAPQDVVRIQLEALQQSADPDTGIEQVWRLAHPDNRRVTGPLARFAVMIKAGFGPMIGHRSHTIEPVGAGPNGQLGFKITLVADDGTVLEYFWTVAQVTDGPSAGAWLTTSVSPGRPGGRAT